MIPNGGELLQRSAPARTIFWMREKVSSFDLLQVLCHCRPAQAFDERHKIYGVLGLAPDASTIVPKPNYSLSVGDVHIDMITKMTQVRNDLDWMMLAGRFRDSMPWPSWCPNLSKTVPAASLNTSRFLPTKTLGFNATLNTSPKVKFDKFNSTCSLHGYVFDEIDGLGPEIGGQERSGQIVQPVSKANAYHTKKDTFDAIWKTVVADQTFEGNEEAWRAPSSFGHIYWTRGLAALSRGQTEDAEAR